MIDIEKIGELLDDNLTRIEVPADALKSFQELAKEFGYVNLAKAIKSCEVRVVFVPDKEFFDTLRNKLKELQADEVPKLDFVCTVEGDTCRYDIFTNYLCSDPFIRLSQFHAALNNELAKSKLFSPIAWKNFFKLVEKKFKACMNNELLIFTVIHVADAKDFLDTYLLPCFDREKVLPQKIIDTCNSPFPRPAIKLSKFKTLWILPADNESAKYIDIVVTYNKLLVCLNQINANLAKVNPAPFNRKLIKAAIKKNIYKYDNNYYCELEDVDDILADVGDETDRLRRIFSAIEIGTVTKFTIDLEE